MRQGPDITRIAEAIGDPARAAMMQALMGGQALTARELAEAAGVAPSTASAHLARLDGAGLVWPRRQGRHRYFAIAGEEVAAALEALAGLAASCGHLRSRPGPKEAELRAARSCYDHLAGTLAVSICDAMAAAGHLQLERDAVALTASGRDLAAALGIVAGAFQSNGRPEIRLCLDWSERRSHLAGAFGAALFARFLDTGWLRRQSGGRHLALTPAGRAGIARAFGAQVFDPARAAPRA
ncbi:helix-turn-helix transcriptional regulator [Poseidonocella sp. HB161398]|uniref:ArsR/SmtB family transcription factor n=1 Tax=Poseidonocella sp. HB161398 TaxID=2320855 RepID=UPI001107C383|nr:winged helix-turn-helix domain-containing protein [Poseidonocella sp. HB161398]